MSFELTDVPSNLLYSITKKLPFNDFFRLRATCKFLNNFLEKYNDKYKMPCYLDFGIDLKNAEEAEFQFNGFLFGIGRELLKGLNKEFVKVEDPLYQIMSVHFKAIDIRAKNGFKCCFSPNDKLNCIMEPKKCLWTMLSTLHLSCDTLELSDICLKNENAFNLLKYVECKSVFMDVARADWIPLVCESCEILKVARIEGDLPAYNVINRFKDVEFWDLKLPVNDTLEDYIIDMKKNKSCGQLKRLRMPVYEAELDGDRIKFPDHIFGLIEIFDSSTLDIEDISLQKLYYMKVNQVQMVVVQLEFNGDADALEATFIVHRDLENVVINLVEILTECTFGRVIDISGYYEDMISSAPEDYKKITEELAKAIFTHHLTEEETLEEGEQSP